MFTARWRTYGLARARLRRKKDKAAGLMQRARRILALALWSDVANGMRRRRSIVARCLCQRMCRWMHNGFDAWLAVLELEGTQRAAKEREEQHLSAMKALEEDLMQRKQALETDAQIQVDKAQAEIKVLQKYLDQVQQEHKFVCDNKNFVSCSSTRVFASFEREHLVFYDRNFQQGCLNLSASLTLALSSLSRLPYTMR
jgi:hypothetical protein